MIYGNSSGSVNAGDLELYVRYDGFDHEGMPHSSHGRCAMFRVRVEERQPGGRCYTARDLYGPVETMVTVEHMLGVLASFLSAAGEAYQSRMAPYGKDADAPWFPAWLQEAAYLNAEELSILACGVREAYWDDEAYPIDPCSGATQDEEIQA